MMKEEREYAYWLCSIPGIGEKTINMLLDVYAEPGRIYEASETELGKLLKGKQLESILHMQKNWKRKEEWERLREAGIQVVFRGEKQYPERLSHIPDAPFALFYKGRLPQEEKLSVAVVGARECSQYGAYVSCELGKYLGTCGIQVISGMARGIDGISQMAALQVGGSSFGVLGSGVDVCYPKSNRGLYERLQECGGVLSSYLPGTNPAAGNFPPRNRIVSGLADALVVVEARAKSGTLITVDMALEQGRDVFVVPGRITDRLSDGCNRLITQGAAVFLTPEDFVEQLRKHTGQKGVKRRNGPEESVEPKKELPKELVTVYRQLELTPKSMDEILLRLPDGYNQVTLSAALMRLCVEGYAKQVSAGRFVLS